MATYSGMSYMLTIVSYGVMRVECGCKDWQEARSTLQWDRMEFCARAMGGRQTRRIMQWLDH